MIQIEQIGTLLEQAYNVQFDSFSCKNHVKEMHVCMLHRQYICENTLDASLDTRKYLYFTLNFLSYKK
jgi:hypothetical protein